MTPWRRQKKKAVPGQKNKEKNLNYPTKRYKNMAQIVNDSVINKEIYKMLAEKFANSTQEV